MNTLYKFPRTSEPLLGYVAALYNRVVFWYARRLAMANHRADGRRYYVIEVFNTYTVLNSRERKAVNASMKRTNRMDIAATLNAALYYTP